MKAKPRVPKKTRVILKGGPLDGQIRETGLRHDFDVRFTIRSAPTVVRFRNFDDWDGGDPRDNFKQDALARAKERDPTIQQVHYRQSGRVMVDEGGLLVELVHP